MSQIITVSIGGIKFEALDVVDLTQRSRAPQHRMEEGYEITDNLLIEPVEFMVRAKLPVEKVKALKSKQEEAKPLTFNNNRFGNFSNMIITNVSSSLMGAKVTEIPANNKKDYANVNVRIRKVRVATSQKVKVATSQTVKQSSSLQITSSSDPAGATNDTRANTWSNSPFAS